MKPPLFSNRVTLAVAVLALPFLAGCWLIQVEQALDLENPFQDIRVVAVAPVFDMTLGQAMLQTDTGYTQARLGEILSSELIQVAGVEVVRSTVVAGAVGGGGAWHPNNPKGPEVAQDLMKRLGADGILVTAITEFDPYGSPRVAAACQFYSSPLRGGRAPEVGQLLQSGRPFALEDGRSHGLLIAFENLYDSNQRWTKAKLGAYARYRHEDGDRALDPEQVHSWDMENYLRFVFHQMIRELVRQGGVLEYDWRKSRGE